MSVHETHPAGVMATITQTLRTPAAAQAGLSPVPAILSQRGSGAHVQALVSYQWQLHVPRRIARRADPHKRPVCIVISQGILRLLALIPFYDTHCAARCCVPCRQWRMRVARGDCCAGSMKARVGCRNGA